MQTDEQDLVNERTVVQEAVGMSNSDMWRPRPTSPNASREASDEQPATQGEPHHDATAPIDERSIQQGSPGQDPGVGSGWRAGTSPWSGGGGSNWGGDAPTSWGQGGAGSGWSGAGPGGGPSTPAPGAPGPGPDSTTMTEPRPWASGAGAPQWVDAETRPIPDPAGAGPSWGGPAPASGQRPPRRGSSRLVAAVLAVLLLLGAGYGLGQLRDRSNASASGNAPGTPVAVNSAQIKGGDEPVASVAKALLPTVVQLETDQGLGSGVIYDKNGYILTAAHVVEGANQVTVRLADGTKLNGRVLGTDDGTDIGVVKVDRNNLQPAALGLKVPLQVGQTAVAIGSPFGLEGSVTSGVVSAVNRSLPNQDNGSVLEVLQTDAPINPGNSGGALADREARVIGINDSIRSESGGNEGIGFAIPIDIAAASAARIVNGQSTDSGYLGVSGTDPALGRAGALVNEVVGGGPAAKAGLQVGDLIISVNGKSVQSMDDLAAQVRLLGPGQKVQLGVVRGGQQQTITATLTKRPNE
jgi:putative serine protease PepD